MRIETRVILTNEELATIKEAFHILDDFRLKGSKVNDPMQIIHSHADSACSDLDEFIYYYEEEYCEDEE